MQNIITLANTPNINQVLSQVFARLAAEYEQIGEVYRAKAYRNASVNIARHPTQIISGKQAQKEIKGIGKSISEKIDEYLRTGTLSIFQELGVKEKEIEASKSIEEKQKESVLNLFEGIYGVGPATANKWYDLGYRTLEQLANVPKTHAQQLGYYYYHQLKERIPRSEMDQLAQRIHTTFSSIPSCSEEIWEQQFIKKFGNDLLQLKPQNILTSQYYLWLNDWLNRATFEQVIEQNRSDLNLLWSKFKQSSQFYIQGLPTLTSIVIDDTNFLNNCNKNVNVEYMICGSYRRGLSNSGDIDILIKAQPNLDLSTFVKTLMDNGLLIGTLAEGKTKYLGIGRLNPQYNARRIDLMIVQPESWAYATLYFTGSQKLNILMRNRAIELGLTLNEYGLYDASGRSYPATTEQEIFEHLQLQYLEPNERSIE